MGFRVFEKVKISTEYFLLEATGNIQWLKIENNAILLLTNPVGDTPRFGVKFTC